MKKYDHNALIKAAIKSFWETKQKQLTASGDSSNRGAVVGGKQLDAFAELLKRLAIEQGVPEKCIYTSQAYLPGYFRSSKDWDFLIIAPNKKLIAAVELKSQIGSYGNNFNNRTEEAIGSAVDLWTAFRENQFPGQTAPWIGYLTVVGKDEGSTNPVRNATTSPIIPSFRNSSRPVIWTATGFSARNSFWKGIIPWPHWFAPAVQTIMKICPKTPPLSGSSFHSLVI